VEFLKLVQHDLQLICLGQDCRPETISRNQYSESNVMHFLFNLLKIKGLYMFQALLVHPQEALHKRHLYIVCVLCQLPATRVGVEL
jgi:hypothetical protein